MEGRHQHHDYEDNIMIVFTITNCPALAHMAHRFLIDSMICRYHEGIFDGDTEDCKDTSLQYFRIPAIFSIIHASSKSRAIFFSRLSTKCKILEGKTLVNQRLIRQNFAPPMFRTIQPVYGYMCRSTP